MADEERLAILRMLSEGKVTVEEADRLLRALGDEPAEDRGRGRGGELTEEIGAEVRRAVRSVQASEIGRTVNAEVKRAVGTVQRLDFGRLAAEIVAQVKGAVTEAVEGASGERVTAEERFDLDAAGVRLIQVEATNGNVRLQGGEGESVAVVAVKRVKARTQAEAEAFAAEVLVTVTQDGERIRVGHQHPQPPEGVQVQVNYSVECPARLGAEVSTANGNLRAAGMAGGVVASTNNGNAHLDQCSGRFELKTRNGNLAVAGAELREEGRLATTNGNVSVEVLAGTGILTATTTNGNVALRLPKDEVQEVPVSASTTNGNVEVRLPDGFRGRVDARTSRGQIHSDFALAAAESARKGELIGQIGEAGGPQLYLRATTGNLRLVRVETPAE